MNSSKGAMCFAALALLAFVCHAAIDATSQAISVDASGDDTASIPDFDGDGTIGFGDFVKFAAKFGLGQGDDGYDARYDLNGDAEIGFSDFVLFAQDFGKEAPSSMDRDVLAALYHATDGDNWRIRTNWLSNRPIGEWYGVTTDASGSSLESLDLWGNQLTGGIPAELGSLSNLEWLQLGWNQLTGGIPAELGNLSNLRWMDLFGNRLTGGIPAELGDLSKLEWLQLGRNQLTGSIPVELGNLSNLERLRLYRNRLTGGIPAELGNLSNLRWLDLFQNRLTGSIPAELGNLSKLERLRLYGTDLCAPTDAAFQAWLRAIADTRGVVYCDGAGGVSYDTPTIVREYDDRVVVMGVPGSLETDPIDLDLAARVFFTHYEDAFDYLMFFSNLWHVAENEFYRYYGAYRSVRNTVQGTGLRSGSRDVGSAGRLKGVIHFPYNRALLSGPSLHEIMHSWANFVIPAKIPHWGFSSANGQLGGFDASNLVDHGGGRYSAGFFGTIANGGNSLPYSPIELYLAGLIPPSEVPVLWLAEDGAWLKENDEPVRDGSGYPIFTASRVSTWSVDHIVAEHGARIPDSRNSQKRFRAVAILLVDQRRPAEQSALDELNAAVSWFCHTGSDDNRLFNFWEATGGRATLAMDGLSTYRGTAAGKPSVSYRILEPVARDDGRFGCVPVGSEYVHEEGKWMVAPSAAETR